MENENKLFPNLYIEKTLTAIEFQDYMDYKQAIENLKSVKHLFVLYQANKQKTFGKGFIVIPMETWKQLVKDIEHRCKHIRTAIVNKRRFNKAYAETWNIVELLNQTTKP